MAKPWPYKSAEELLEAGYTFDRPSRCSAIYKGGTCNASIEWWFTREGKHIPLDHGTYQPHWATCPDAELFRGKGRTKP